MTSARKISISAGILVLAGFTAGVLSIVGVADRSDDLYTPSDSQ